MAKMETKRRRASRVRRQFTDEFKAGAAIATAARATTHVATAGSRVIRIQRKQVGGEVRSLVRSGPPRSTRSYPRWQRC